MIYFLLFLITIYAPINACEQDESVQSVQRVVDNTMVQANPSYANNPTHMKKLLDRAKVDPDSVPQAIKLLSASFFSTNYGDQAAYNDQIADISEGSNQALVTKKHHKKIKSSVSANSVIAHEVVSVQGVQPLLMRMQVRLLHVH